MAIELGQRNVKDTDAYNDYAIGLSLPLQFDKATFAQTYNTMEQVKSNLKNLLLTKRGERVLHPDFGCPLTDLVFDQLDDELETKIEDVINDSIEMWMPYINIEEIVVDMSDKLKDRNKVNISVSFKVGQDINLNQVTFTVES